MFPISDSSRGNRFPAINMLLIAVTCYVFFLEITAANPDSFILRYALIPAYVSLNNPNTWLPFLTSIFLHGGWLHIISNLWFLFIFGDNVEEVFGTFPYLMLYLGSGIVGGLAQYLITPGSEIPMLGASGAIAGVLGAYFALFPHNKVKTLIPIFGFITFANVSAFFMLGYWFVLQIISGAASLPGSGPETGGVAFWAHVGGFVAGFIYGKLYGKRESNVLEGEVISG
jgi:membrane associated rhomboid family serine protease